MAFAMAKNQPPLSDQENISGESKTTSSSSVTSQLYLKSSAGGEPNNSHAALDRDVVLRRIRYHKRMEKARRKLQAVLGKLPPPLAETDGNMSVYEHKLLQMGDVFSSP